MRSQKYRLTDQFSFDTIAQLVNFASPTVGQSNTKRGKTK
jgi:hypothetical protein